MSEQTKISWTDHTFNPWWGCTQISPGCDNCYAKALDSRFGGNYWAPKTQPRQTLDSNWDKVVTWNRKARDANKRDKVFCGSMMDWCDNQVPNEWRDQLFTLIWGTQYLNWQLLTKRADRIQKCLPSDWYQGFPNVWLGVSVEDKKHGYPRIDALREIPATVRFLSVEPMLCDMSDIELEGIDWVIIGGESGSGCRRMNPEWAFNLMRICGHEKVPVFFKQWGGNTKGKGGCLIDGYELKQWPKCCFHHQADHSTENFNK